jgi:RNA recognition motif-containing protein
MDTRLESMQLQDDATPMHIFDIRRSNSVTELWRRYEDNSIEQFSTDEGKCDIPDVTPSVLSKDQHEAPASNETILPPVFNEPPSLMEAFEAELADILNSAETSEKRSTPSDSPPTPNPSASTDSERTPHPVEILATQLMDQLINGANMVQGEWRSMMPDLQRQLQNAQRQFEAAHKSLPENMEVSLRTLLANLEAHMKAAFGNIPNGGRQMAEDVFQAGRPVAENAADGFRMMASEFNEVGRTLFAAFESEFGRTDPNTASSNAPAAPEPAYPQNSAYFLNTATNEKSSTLDASKTSGAAASAQSPSPLGTASGDQPHHHLPPHLDRWAPPSFPSPFVDFSQSYNAPPHAPRISPLHLPHYAPNSPQRPPTLRAHWAQYRASQKPQFQPEPRAPSFNASSQVERVPIAESEASKQDQETKSLFIGNVGFKVTAKMIQGVFASKGFIVDVDLPMDSTSGRHAGFGYVHFPSDPPAFAAMEALQGALIDGHSINLEHMDHPPIERVHPVQSNDKYNAAGAVVTQSSRTELSDVNDTAFERYSPVENIASPSAASSRSSSMKDSKKFKPLGGVNFVGAGSSSTGFSNARAESSALLDSPGDDAAFSARFPSLLPGTGAQHNAQLNTQVLPSGPHAGELEMSRFPPVSQLEAQLFASPPVTNSNEAPLAAKLKRRATDYNPHQATPRHAGMRDLNERSHGAVAQGTGVQLSKGERSGFSSHPQLPGSFPTEEMRLASTSTKTDESARGSDGADIEACVSALVDIGYGTEQEGGRPRMAVYAAAANGSLMDAIDMIEEERRVYERRASQ